MASVSVRTTVDTRGLTRLARRLRTEPPVLSRQSAERARRDMQGRGPRVTGRLLRELTVVQQGPFYAVTGRTPYLPFVVFGTRPHLIRARGARALRWQAGTGVAFARVVRHPGTRPNRFMQDAAERERPRLVSAALRMVTG